MHVQNNPVNWVDPWGLVNLDEYLLDYAFDTQNYIAPYNLYLKFSKTLPTLSDNPVGNSIFWSMIRGGVKGAAYGAFAGITFGPAVGLTAPTGFVLGSFSGLVYGTGGGFISGASIELTKEVASEKKANAERDCPK